MLVQFVFSTDLIYGTLLPCGKGQGETAVKNKTALHHYCIRREWTPWNRNYRNKRPGR